MYRLRARRGLEKEIMEVEAQNRNDGRAATTMRRRNENERNVVNVYLSRPRFIVSNKTLITCAII